MPATVVSQVSRYSGYMASWPLASACMITSVGPMLWLSETGKPCGLERLVVELSEQELLGGVLVADRHGRPAGARQRDASCVAVVVVVASSVTSWSS